MASGDEVSFLGPVRLNRRAALSRTPLPVAARLTVWEDRPRTWPSSERTSGVAARTATDPTVTCTTGGSTLAGNLDSGACGLWASAGRWRRHPSGASSTAAAAEAAVPRLPPPLQRPRRFVELVVLGVNILVPSSDEGRPVVHFRSCQARPSAEREGQGLTDNTLWKLGEAGRSSRSYRDPRDREVPFGQSSTCEWETEAKAALGSGRFLVGGFCSEYPVDTAGQACSESCCSFPFSSVSQLPSSRAPQTWGFCPVTVGARPDNKVGTGRCFRLAGTGGHCLQQGPGNPCRLSAPGKSLEGVSWVTVRLASAGKTGSPPSTDVTGLTCCVYRFLVTWPFSKPKPLPDALGVTGEIIRAESGGSWGVSPRLKQEPGSRSARPDVSWAAQPDTIKARRKQI
ncbi:uncharacterized protein LOC123803190 [Ursus americanus]|uniref:uncharacterized protein LOC123803190 n=1 Tax=Ursus americanus TaxID=9643 RepID=UPI001E67B983|nr:uncharacterized protein LOC123803190 [Ursus americanus]